MESPEGVWCGGRASRGGTEEPSIPQQASTEGRRQMGFRAWAWMPHPWLQREPGGLRVPVPCVQGHFHFSQKDVATQAFTVPHREAQHPAVELGLRDGVLGTGGAL